MALVDSTQQLLEAAMRGAWQRQTALTNNIANAETPGYQPQEVSFESAVAKWLNHEIATGKIGTLFVIAPPRALGELRLHYGEALKKKLVGELPKEHTHDTVHFLEQALKSG